MLVSSRADERPYVETLKGTGSGTIVDKTLVVTSGSASEDENCGGNSLSSISSLASSMNHCDYPLSQSSNHRCDRNSSSHPSHWLLLYHCKASWLPAAWLCQRACPPKTDGLLCLSVCSSLRRVRWRRLRQPYCRTLRRKQLGLLSRAWIRWENSLL